MKRKTGRYASKKVLVILFALSMACYLGLAVGGTVFSAFLTRVMEQNIQYRLLAVSKMASQLVTIDELEQYQTAEDMELPSYNTLRHKLWDFSREYNVVYAYYIRKSGDRQLQYIVDNDFNEETRVGLDTPPYDIQPVPWIKLALEGKASHSGLGNYTPGWEGLLTTYTPLVDKDGNVAAIAGVDISDESIVFARRTFNILTLLQTIVFVIVFASGFIILLHYRVEAQKSLEAAYAKSVFLSEMGRKFRMPLKSILGMGTLIRQTKDLSLIHYYTYEILVAGQNLLSLFKELIEHSNDGKNHLKAG
jgi:hypothetical protein